MSNCTECKHYGDHLNGPAEKLPYPCVVCEGGSFFVEPGKEGAFSPAQRALDKLCRASKRGTGTRLTAEEVRSLSVTVVGELWAQDNPEK